MRMTPARENILARIPRWSLAASFWALFTIGVFSTALTLLVLHQPVWIEFEVISAIVAAMLFFFYWYVLYTGVKFTDEELTFEFVPLKLDFSDPSISGDIIASADDPVSFVFALFLEVVLFIGLTIGFAALWALGVNLVLLNIALVAVPLFCIFKTSIYYILAVQRRCRRRFFKSGAFAALMTSVKMSWVCAGIYLGHLIMAR
jgi:hypothetical protein